MVNHDNLMQHLQLEQVLGTIPSGLFIVDLDMRVLYWNDAAERITGFTATEAVGQHCSFLQGIPCGEQCGLYDNEIPKPVVGGRCTIVTKSGETIHLLKNIEYLRDTDGEIIGGVESFVDITRQHQLEQVLRDETAALESRVEARTLELSRSEARFRAVLDTMHDFAYIATPDCRISFINRAMQDQFGDIIGQPCHKALFGRDGICPWCPMDRIRHDRTVREERTFGPLGRTYEVIHSPLQSENGQIFKLAVCRDITERKETETALREANRELDAFAHSISHDLRGILAPVVTYMDFLRLQYGSVFDDQILQILGEVERQSERAIALLDDLLDLAQVGHVEPGKTMTDVTKLVQEVIDERDTAPILEQHKIVVGDLPTTWVPETLIYQVFANLIGNACNYSDPANGPIEVGCWEEEDRYIYYVRDHGQGVKAAERETIFEIFYRGKVAGDKRGTGVGLAIVRKIALRCQGAAWVEDTPGGGSTFCVSFPIKGRDFLRLEPGS